MTRTKALRMLTNILNIQDFTNYSDKEKNIIRSAIVILGNKLVEVRGKDKTVYKNKFEGISDEY